MATDSSLKQTPLVERHVRLGGRMVPFGGWLMPVQYPAGILAEHQHTRTQASLFDTCHMGAYRVTGADSANALDAVLPRGVRNQPIGTCRYNFLLTEAGTVVDDLVVYRLAASEFLLVGNAGTAAGDGDWLEAHLAGRAELRNDCAALGKLDLQGPHAFEVLADLGLPRERIPAYYRWARVDFLGWKDVLISRTGYTGERGIELYLPRERVGEVWDRLTAHPLVKPAGLGARDTLRLEMGYPLYGHELNLDTTPLEAGFGAFVELVGREFPGAAALRAQPPRKRLVALRLEGRRAARAGMAICDSGTRAVRGQVSSGTFAPSLQCAIALGFMFGPEAPAPGSAWGLGDPAGGAALLPATVVPLPFYRHGTCRQ